jgi:hypothetical protein
MVLVRDAIIDLLNQIGEVDLDAPTRDGRRNQLANYRSAYNLLMDAAGPVPPSHEYFNAKAKANVRLTELETYFESYECVRMACQVIIQANSKGQNVQS